MANKDDDAAKKAREDRREAERQARLTTGRAQPLNADRPVDRQTRKRAREN
jgi:hypothetical protein